MKPRIIHLGERYGRLVVAAQRNPGEARVQCVCDCGREHSVVLQQWGRSQSCGCLRTEQLVARSTRHGMANSSEYAIWAQMVQRCTTPTHARYADYGGRGITVCTPWLDFAQFYADMGSRPGGMSLDRIDNDRGYEPGNCRWATAVEQRHNRRGSRRAA